MPESTLREPLEKVLLDVQDGKAIGHQLLARDDLQALVLFALADIYQRLPDNTKSRSIIPNGLTWSDPKRKSRS